MMHGLYPATEILEMDLQQLNDLRVIFNDQNVLHQGARNELKFTEGSQKRNEFFPVFLDSVGEGGRYLQLKEQKHYNHHKIRFLKNMISS